MNTPNFSDIYTLYFEDVYKYLLALCHDEELAEELAQDNCSYSHSCRNAFDGWWRICCFFFNST